MVIKFIIHHVLESIQQISQYRSQTVNFFQQHSDISFLFKERKESKQNRHFSHSSKTLANRGKITKIYQNTMLENMPFTGQRQHSFLTSGVSHALHTHEAKS
jgi:hypothetical protein